jgi:DNA-binding response OmpR family regulator
MSRVLVLDTEAWRASALSGLPGLALPTVSHIDDPHQIDALTGPLAAAVIVMRDPLQIYLSAVRQLKSRRDPPPVLAIFASGELAADYALMAALAEGADAVLYCPHSEIELVAAVQAMLSPGST